MGWSHLLYARWANRWHDLQHQHGKNNNIRIMDVRAWTKKVIEILWEHAYQRWIQRAQKLQGESESLPEGELTERVRRLYEKRRELPRRYQFLFMITKEQMLNRDTKRIRKWVQDTETIAHRAIMNLKRRHKEQTRMEVWLRWERRKKNRRRTQS